jgi:hypothetical protein
MEVVLGGSPPIVYRTFALNDPRAHLRSTYGECRICPVVALNGHWPSSSPFACWRTSEFGSKQETLCVSVGGLCRFGSAKYLISVPQGLPLGSTN